MKRVGDVVGAATCISTSHWPSFKSTVAPFQGPKPMRGVRRKSRGRDGQVQKINEYISCLPSQESSPEAMRLYTNLKNFCCGSSWE
jgi:hypothetical protein